MQTHREIRHPARVECEVNPPGQYDLLLPTHAQSGPGITALGNKSDTLLSQADDLPSPGFGAQGIVDCSCQQGRREKQMAVYFSNSFSACSFVSLRLARSTARPTTGG
jgi:hypothetical protein